MSLVVIISSFVAASRVGGGIAPFVLTSMGVETVHIPTTLFGRHPGWGAPGGEKVSPESLSSMIQAIEAQGVLERADAILIGYFGSQAQVTVVEDMLRRLGETAVGSKTGERIIVLDPIIGDEGPGQYVSDEIREALKSLLPFADVVTPNLWEMGALLDQTIPELANLTSHVRSVLRVGQTFLVTSVRTGDEIGAALITQKSADLASTPMLKRPLPNGRGDLLTLLFTAWLVCGATPLIGLQRAVGSVTETLRRSGADSALGLALIESQGLFAAENISSDVSCQKLE